MTKLFRTTHLGKFLLPVLGVIAFLFALSFNWGFLFPVAQGLTVVLLALVLAELFILYGGQIDVSAEREIPQLLSLGDENEIELKVQNLSSIGHSGPLVGTFLEKIEKSPIKKLRAKKQAPQQKADASGAKQEGW